MIVTDSALVKLVILGEHAPVVEADIGGIRIAKVNNFFTDFEMSFNQ